MRIDIHVHYMPPELANDSDFFNREPFWQYLARPNSKKSVQGWATAERMIEDMDRSGIDMVVVQGEYFQSHESCVSRNNRVLELMRRWPDRLKAFAIVQPKAGRYALDELERCLEYGMCGVGELSPFAQGYRLEDPTFIAVAELCVSRNIPLLLHTNEEVGRHYRGKVPVAVTEYYHFAERFPELKIVLAHWGGGLFFYEILPEVKKALANVRYDTAASPLVFPSDRVFQVAMQCLGADKILYGSDYPLIVYPKRQDSPDFRPFLEEIARVQLDPAWYTAIMGGNASHLLDTQIDTSRHVGKVEPATRIASEITSKHSIRLIAEAWPATRSVFDKYGIQWKDDPLPFWVPVEQSACALGMSPEDLRRLLQELNEAAGRSDFPGKSGK